MKRKKEERPIEEPILLSKEIIVKFREGGRLEESEGRFRADHLSLDRFHSVLRSLKGAQAYRSFVTDTESLSEMQSRASRRLRRLLPSLDLFVRVRLTPHADVDALINEFTDDPEIEYACIAGTVAPPPAPPPTPDFTSQQGYLDPAPTAVDAAYAWFYPGGDGTGVQICDCEQGLDPNHEDLPIIKIVSNRDNDLSNYDWHGTCVMGEIVAKADSKGVTGICHGATALFASGSAKPPKSHHVDCVTDALKVMKAGDVLLIEMQNGPMPYKPQEYDPDFHAALVTATGLDITVVAGAGNGNNIVGTDLATEKNALGKYIWDPSSKDYDDSGAIMVGGGMSPKDQWPRSKAGYSNYGDRVNCQGWGFDVVTTGWDGNLYNGGPNAKYNDHFKGTSSAAPIVAGVVACVQGAALQAFGVPLDPNKVRSLVADPANGSPQVDSPTYPAANYHIGPQPDLRRVLKAAGIYPDVYMRDSVSDTGQAHMAPILFLSPDIIPRKDLVANPSVTFGPNTWNNAYLGENIEFGQKNYIYVRMHNRGNAPDDVTVTMYWAVASTFLHPSKWSLIDTLSVKNVKPGEHRVAGPIIWPETKISKVNYYCLIAVVNSLRDRITIPGVFSTVTDYLNFIRNHNNICYRNVDVEDILPNKAPPPCVFLLNGLQEKLASFRLEVLPRLPDRSEVMIEVKQRLPEFERLEILEDEESEIRYLALQTRFLLKDNGPLILNDVRLKQNAAIPVEIQTKLPEEALPGEYLVHADQYLGDLHLGRVNCVLCVGKPQPESLVE